MIDFLAENFNMRFNTFVVVQQIYAPLKTHSPLKSVKLQKNCNLNWLKCRMTQFCIVVSTKEALVVFH